MKPVLLVASPVPYHVRSLLRDIQLQVSRLATNLTVYNRADILRILAQIPPNNN
jgi:hypothetical protein